MPITFIRVRVFRILMIICLASLWIPYHVNAEDSTKTGSLDALPTLNVKSAILLDAATGQIIYATNENQAFPPASMAKMMTEYMVMDAVKSGKIKWDDIVTTSDYASQVVGSKALLAVGEQLTVKEMFTAMAIYSANDATIALAEYIGGSEDAFAKLLNERARSFGLSKDANFINATGLSRADMAEHASLDLPGETMLTAKDAAIIGWHIVHDHPEALEFTKMKEYKLRDRDDKPMINWDWMVEGNKDNLYLKKYAYEGLDGLKTGHTSEAGFCFTGSAVRNGMRLISTVMGTESEPQRFEETRKLLDYGFNNFELRTIVPANTTLVQMPFITVKKGVLTDLPVVTKSDVRMMVKKGAQSTPYDVKVEILPDEQRTAPIANVTKLGSATITYNGVAEQVDLVSSEQTDEAGWFRLFFRAIGQLIVDLWHSLFG